MPIALITGATSGIGLEFARQLARSGYDLVLVARTAPDLARVAADLTGTFGVTCEELRADLSTRIGMDTVAARCASATRPVDLLVNNAGFGVDSAFCDTDIELSRDMLAVMSEALMVVSYAAARRMRAVGRGGIITVSSVAGYASFGVYSAVKAFATAFTEGLHSELRGTGVHVTCVCPGFVHTGFHDRADMDMGWLPGPLWLDVEQCVHDTLAAARRNQGIVVPGWGYRSLVSVMRHAPRPLVRRGGHAVGTRRRTHT